MLKAKSENVEYTPPPIKISNSTPVLWSSWN